MKLISAGVLSGGRFLAPVGVGAQSSETRSKTKVKVDGAAARSRFSGCLAREPGRPATS